MDANVYEDPRYTLPAEIGNYRIYSCIGDKIGIQHKDGEAGEFSKEKFEKVIDKFFREEF